MTPLFSIVIPAYNVAAFIPATLASVFAQTELDAEVIVVNDGSPDTELLEAAIAPYLDRIHYVVQENRGLAGARNTALRAARGRFLAFLDGDDIWEENCLEVQRRAIEADPTLDAVYGDGIFFGEPALEGKRLMEILPPQGPVTFENVVSGRTTVFVGACVARRELVELVGGFDETLRSAEDLDLWLRMLLRGARIENHRHVVLRYRRHPASLSANAAALTRWVIRVNEKMSALDLTDAQMSAVQQRLKQMRSDLAWYLGQAALDRRDSAGAAEHWKEANQFRKSLRISASVGLLKFAPAAFYWLNAMRGKLQGRAAQAARAQ